ncbi:MAG: hypothetical protein ACYC1Z_05525 [Georgenia sp.]
MTVYELFTCLIRRWYVVLVGLALTAGVVLGIRVLPGVWFGQVNVVFLVPTEGKFNPLSVTTQSLVSTAGAVARAVAGPDARYQATAEGVTLLDEGVVHGHSVRLPNAGGQWDYRFDDPILDVQAAGATRVEAEAEMTKALAQVEAALSGLEDRAGVPGPDRILTRLNPAEPTYRYDDGSRMRAVGAAGLIGVILTGAAAVVIDSRGRARREGVHVRADHRQDHQVAV